MASCPQSKAVAQQNELEETLQASNVKNTELKSYLNTLREENALYKKRYNDLKRSLKPINESLENSVQLSYQLYIDCKSILDTSRNLVCESPTRPTQSLVAHCRSSVVATQNQYEELPNTQDKNAVNSRVETQVVSVQKFNVLRPKIYIEKLKWNGEHSMAGLDNEDQSISQELYPDDTITIQKLSTITEEEALFTEKTSKEHNSYRKAPTSVRKELCVVLERLPDNLMNQELPNRVSPNSTLNFSWHSLDPNFISTPLKLETMKSLGLSPNNMLKKPHDFVTKRRDNRSKRLQAHVESEASLPPNKKMSTSISSSSENSGNIKERPTRKAKPTKKMTEESLRVKKRRD